MSLLSDAVHYPKNREDGLVNPIAAGGILQFLSNFILPLPFLLGYWIRVLGDTIDGDPEPPEFGDWGSLYVLGLKGIVPMFVALLVPSLVMVSMIDMVTTPYGTGGPAGAAFGVIIFGALLFAGFWYVVPAALGNMARSGRLRDAFSFRRVMGVVTTRQYFVGFVLGTAIYLGFAFALGVILIIPLLGALVFIFGGTFIMFYASVAAFYLYGRGYAHALGLTPEPVQASEAGTAAGRGTAGTDVTSEQSGTVSRSSDPADGDDPV